MCIPQCKLPLAMPWKEEMLSGRGSWKGRQHFSWDADQWLGCSVVGSEAWPTSVVFNQVQVGLSCWCLVFGVGRWKRLDSHAQLELETFCSEVKLRQMCVTGELGSEG